MAEPLTLHHRSMRMTFAQEAGILHQTGIYPGEQTEAAAQAVPCPPFQLAVAGRSYGFHNAITQGYAELPMQMTARDVQCDAQGLRAVYTHPNGLEVEVCIEPAPGANVLRQTTSVVNRGPAPVVLTHLSGAFVQGIAADGLLPWHDPRKLRLHHCVQTWNGEGQWRQNDLETMGLYPTSTHPCASAINLTSQGTWSTGHYAPVVFLEDLETQKIWYFQLESSTHWHIEIGCRGSWDGGDGTVYVQCDTADERYSGWTLRLAPGERFTAPAVAYGCCEGGFADAVRELIRYKRALCKPADAWDGDCPVVFNDYMNCLWGNPTAETLRPLIDAAVAVGVECFCIDAGWYAPRISDWALLGDWEPSADRFGPRGLQGVLDDIRAHGMIPGLWLELEVCTEAARLFQKPDDWFLLRNGQRVAGGGRYFLNFTNPAVRAYLHAVVDRLVAMGVGYFKNDYNACVSLGDDRIGSSAPDGLLRNVRAFYAFLDEVRARHPRLILENCGSGGMRADAAILSHFHLQSSSDQENYLRYPSLLAGSLANVLPEQLGIWAYPYPLLFEQRQNPEILSSDAYQACMADGEQTIFNLVSGLCGNLYLSGHLEAADERNRALIRQGVALYKQERGFIRNAFPFWPIGMTRMGDAKSWCAVGLASDPDEQRPVQRMLLAVWRLDSVEEVVRLPLLGLAGRKAAARLLYPAAGHDVPYAYLQNEGALEVRLGRRQGRLFEVLA